MGKTFLINSLEDMCDAMCDNIVPSDRMTREEAIKVLQKSTDNTIEMTIREWEEFDKKVAEAIDMAIEALQMDIVQCKDCKRYDDRNGEVCHNPRYGDGWANYPPPDVSEDYWCKDGERRGGGSE